MNHLLLILLAFCMAAPFNAARAQEEMSAQEQLALSRKKNKVQTALDKLEKKYEKVSRMYAKTETSADYNKKSGEMEKSQVFNVEQEMLYNKGLIIYYRKTHDKLNQTSDLDEKLKVAEHLDAFLDKMAGLKGKDTKKLEKQLKKAENSDEVYQLITGWE